MATPIRLAAALAALPLLAVPAAARPVTASQLSAAPYGRVPIRSNRPEWEVYNGYRPGGSPWSGIVGTPGPVTLPPRAPPARSSGPPPG